MEFGYNDVSTHNNGGSSTATKLPSWRWMLIAEEAVRVWGQEVYGISLCPKSKIIFLKWSLLRKEKKKLRINYVTCWH